MYDAAAVDRRQQADRLKPIKALIESNLTHYIKGTGLGLPIVRQIIQMHGGRTWAESVANQGSTFHFVIPYTASATVPLEENPPTA